MSEPEQVEAPKAGRPRKSWDWPAYESKKQAAEVLGCPVERLSQMQRAGAPGFEHGRVYLEPVIKWILREGVEDPDTDWSRELKKEQTLEKQDARKVREGQLVNKQELSTEIIRLETLTTDLLERGKQELPPDLKGRDEGAIHKILGKWIDEVQDARREKLASIIAEADVAPSVNVSNKEVGGASPTQGDTPQA